MTPEQQEKLKALEEAAFIAWTTIGRLIEEAHAAPKDVQRALERALVRYAASGTSTWSPPLL